jgi:hypothetical protein
LLLVVQEVRSEQVQQVNLSIFHLVAKMFATRANNNNLAAGQAEGVGAEVQHEAEVQQEVEAGVAQLPHR